MRAAAKSPSVRRKSPGEIALTHDRGNKSPRPHHQAAVTFASPQEAASKLVAAIRERVLAKRRTGRTRHCLAEPGERNLRPAPQGVPYPDRLLMSPCSMNTADAQEGFPTIGFSGPFVRFPFQVVSKAKSPVFFPVTRRASSLQTLASTKFHKESKAYRAVVQLVDQTLSKSVIRKPNLNHPTTMAWSGFAATVAPCSQKSGNRRQRRLPFRNCLAAVDSQVGFLLGGARGAGRTAQKR